jgi:hypothetical protein
MLGHSHTNTHARTRTHTHSRLARPGSPLCLLLCLSSLLLLCLLLCLLVLALFSACWYWLSSLPVGTGSPLCLLVLALFSACWYWLSSLPDRHGTHWLARALSDTRQGWLATGQTLKQAAACPQTFKFLVAYFFYSDSYSTVQPVYRSPKP